MELHSLNEEIEAEGAEVWAISSDEEDRLRSFRDQEGLGFTFLRDPEGATFETWGIRNERSDRTIPHPTVVVVDTEGVVRWVASDENYKVRPPASDVLDALRGLSSDEAR